MTVARPFAFSPAYYRGLRMLAFRCVGHRKRQDRFFVGQRRPARTTVTGAGVHMRCDTFERQMRWLAAHYTVLSLTEFVDRQTR